ncbi:MAG TPA: OmpA family protein [Myxococcota bacterium]|nr:OmpA family protein [Myxococcota bacterium]
MSRVKVHLCLTACVIVLGACARAPIPYQDPVPVTPPSGPIAVRQAVTIFDASGSQADRFADGKATLESVVAAMPDGAYQAGQIHFGGTDREGVPVSAFDRSQLASAAREATFLEGTSPLYAAFENDLAAAIGDGEGRAAVVLISDGLATDLAGRSGVEERTLEAARRAMEGRDGEVCFHTIQSGDSVVGGALLQSIAGLSECGSARNASSLSSASALQAFAREVYLSEAPGPEPEPAATPVSTPLPDSDGDGVADPMDACAGTLARARVDSRGCWTLSELRFAVNGDEIEMGFASGLSEDIEVLEANPDVRVRIDGHTDSDGSAAYNQSLSRRRAESVRDYMVSQGLDADRFEIRGFGESQPIGPNDSEESKRRNRRVELTILD